MECTSLDRPIRYYEKSNICPKGTPYVTSKVKQNPLFIGAELQKPLLVQKQTFHTPKTISNDNTKNTRSIYPLGSATGKRFNIYSASSPTTRPKREFFLQIGLQERWYPYLDCASQTTQNRSSVYVLCLRLILDLLLPILGLAAHMDSSLETV